MRPAVAALPLLLMALSGCGPSVPPQSSLPTPDPPPPVSLAEELETIPPIPATPEPPAGPLAIFGGDGTYVVGTDILPGIYRSQGPAFEGLSCIWWRLSDTTGDQGAVIAADSTRGPVTITVKDSDAAVRTSGCTGWAKVD